MRLRHLAGTWASTCVIALAVTLSTPALAKEKRGFPGERPHGRDMRPDWRGDRGPGYGPEFGRIREQWLMDCRGRVADRGGRTEMGYAPPPISGPVTGRGPIGGPPPLAGPPMGGACESAFDNYYATYGDGPGPGVIMVPVVIPAPPCTETVTTNYVPTARRVIPRRPAPGPDKRIRIAPDKRIPIK